MSDIEYILETSDDIREMTRIYKNWMDDYKPEILRRPNNENQSKFKQLFNNYGINANEYDLYLLAELSKDANECKLSFPLSVLGIYPSESSKNNSLYSEVEQSLKKHFSKLSDIKSQYQKEISVYENSTARNKEIYERKVEEYNKKIEDCGKQYAVDEEEHKNNVYNISYKAYSLTNEFDEIMKANGLDDDCEYTNFEASKVYEIILNILNKYLPTEQLYKYFYKNSKNPALEHCSENAIQNYYDFYHKYKEIQKTLGIIKAGIDGEETVTNVLDLYNDIIRVLKNYRFSQGE